MKTVTKYRTSIHLFLVLIGSISIQQVSCQNVIEVSGHITEKTEWIADTVKVTGDITVEDGVRLIIRSGNYIEFQGHYKLHVEGRIIASGEPYKKIVFTILDTTGFHNYKSTSGGWYGISINADPNRNSSSSFSYCIFEYAKATDEDLQNYIQDDYGGAIRIWDSPPLNISNCIIRNSLSEISGGGISIKNTEFTVQSSMICNNYSMSGGGIYLHRATGTLNNNLIANNSVSAGGGGITYWYSQTVLMNNTIVNNTAYNGGGAYIIYTNPPRLVNNIFWGNSARNKADQFHPSDLKDVTYCNIEGGYAGTGNINNDPLFRNPTQGKGITFDALEADWSFPQNSSCTDAGKPDFTFDSINTTYDVIGNHRIYNNGIDIGAYEHKGEPVYITENTTWCDPVKEIWGDVIIAKDAKLEIYRGSKIEFQGHYKIIIHGRIDAYGTPDQPIVFTINDTTGFYDMESFDGGWHGIRFENTNEHNYSQLVNCTFEYGKATNGFLRSPSAYYDNSGGALNVHNFSNLRLSKCVFRNNRASKVGGAIDTYNSDIQIFSNKICNNEAYIGGGVHLGAKSSARIVNNLIANNESYMGGGLVLSRNSFILLNNTIVNNMANSHAGIVVFTDGDVKFYNNMLWGNRTTESNYISDLVAMDVRYCNIEEYNSGEGNICSDPQFINPSEGAGIKHNGLSANWDILANSPCVNAGDPDYTWELGDPTNDLKYINRVMYDTIDIGAYEFTEVYKVPCHIEAENSCNMYYAKLIESKDHDGGKNVGFIEDKAFLGYIIDVKNAGEYWLKMRLASECPDGSFIVNWFGEVFIQEANIPYTFDWNNYVTLPIKINLPKITLGHFGFYFKGTPYIANLNYFEITHPDTSFQTIPAKIEAEDFNDFSGVVVGSYESGKPKEYIGWLDKEDYVEYNIISPKTDTFVLDIATAAIHNEGIIEVYDNGISVGKIPVENTGGWEKFTTLTHNLELTEGLHAIRMVFKGTKTGICNVDYLEIKEKEKLPIEISEIIKPDEIKVYPNPVQKSLTIESSDLKPIQKIEIFDITGRIVNTCSHTGTSKLSMIDIGLKKGTYILKVYFEGSITTNKCILVK